VNVGSRAADHLSYDRFPNPVASMREYDGWFPRVSIITTLLDKDSPSLFRLSGDFPVGLRKGRVSIRSGLEWRVAPTVAPFENLILGDEGPVHRIALTPNVSSITR